MSNGIFTQIIFPGLEKKMKSPTEQNEEKSHGREWLKNSQKWAGKASLPLMTHLGRASHLVTQKLVAEIKISISQIRVLFEALDPNGVSQSFLGKRYNVDPASITRTVQAMERDGLITRKPDASDNRLMRVYITEKGRELLETIPPRLFQFEQYLLEGWTESEIIQLHSFLDRIEQRMDIDQHIKRYNQEREAH
ncbi:MAG: MarR family transcriptional protein [Chloroflexi bacterium]|jgi:DNA-binding MarR family transcriptional regulator|nr:MarR family transcriptional protein [Chloroflexota bacterium]